MIPEAASAVPWTRAALTWMLMMLVETGHGFVREVFIAPAIGGLRARQVGVVIGSILVLMIAGLCARWMGVTTRRAQLVTGAFWVVLTLAFELSVGRTMGLTWDRLLSDYNPARGGFMAVGLLVMFLAPLWVARWPMNRKR